MVWKLVEQALEEGTLEQLRNSKNREEIPGAPPKKGSNSRAAKTKDAKTKDAKEIPLPKKTYAPLDVPKNRREARAAAGIASAVAPHGVGVLGCDGAGPARGHRRRAA